MDAGGSLPPIHNARVTRRYRDDTLILETEFETPDGAATLIDFMPIREGAHHLVRIVTGRRGQLAMRTELVLRFDYGATVPWVTRADDGALEAVTGPDMTLLRTPIDLRGEDFKTLGDFTVSEGQTVPFVLSFGRSYREQQAPIDPIAALSDTEVFWRNWSAGCTGMGEWSALVRRSLITLKALTYRPTGGIVAAPTMSLPERFGGTRNWDYRYCWIRDASLDPLEPHARRLLRGSTALAGLAAARGCGASGTGSDHVRDRAASAGSGNGVPWLPGYQGAGPVRIGNAASGQFQLDVYGEILDAFYQASRGRAWSCQPRSGPATRAVGSCGGGLARTRRRHVGSARPAPAFHPLQSHGVDGFRPRDKERRRLRLRGAS